MAQTIGEQINVVERALGERMIDTALVVVRSWLNELGENNHYKEAYDGIRKSYASVFANWLSANEENADEQLNKLTGDTYQLVDAVYADIRLKRGLSPAMHGFNQDNPLSVLHYFHHCVRLREEDFEWFHDVLNDEERSNAALMTITALTRNLRECFSIDAIMCLIDGMASENETIADQCIANVLTLLVHYDVRIDFFPQVQKAFLDILNDNDANEHVFEVLLAVIESSQRQWLEMYAAGMLPTSELPKELQKLIEMSGIEHDLKALMEWLPESENEYMKNIIQLLPDTWVYEVLTEEDIERERMIALTGVRAGFRDMMWNYPDYLVYEFRNILRKGSEKPLDYINYAHCLLLTGDRIMAFEYYKQARKLCKSSKEFFNLFRPDRRALVDRGIPLEQIYLLEDNLLNA